MKLWHIALLIVAGLVVGEAKPGALAETFRIATLYVFLPALIFEAAWNLDFSLMRRAWIPIVMLAVPGVAISAAVVAFVVHRLGGVAPATALMIGAILSATDPVAVVAIFRRLKVPPVLATIVESESLLNDAIAVVLYRAVIASILGGASAAVAGNAALQAGVGSLLGIALGIATGALAAIALRKRNGVAVQSAATFVAAYGAYLIAEHVHWSGIFALISCGIAMRELERRSIDVEVALGVERVWSVAATIANAILFFLVGAAVQPSRLLHERQVLLWTLASVLLARAVVAYGLLSLVPGMRGSWKALVRLAGVRGVLSLALALAIPGEIAGRAEAIDAVFLVVIFTLLLGALTLDRRVAGLEL